MKKILVGLLVGVLIGVGILILLKNTPTDNYCKNYIIEHQDEIVLGDYQESGRINYKIPKVKGYYWGDITIRHYDGDNRYRVIFWSDRQKMENKDILW